MRFRHLERGGPYLRVADPDRRRPLDDRFAAERGGRWNAPGSFPVVYLCASRDGARANVLRRFAGQPYSLLDLRPVRRPTLVETAVPTHRAVDVVTDAGCRAAGLPETYPLEADGSEVGWERCHPVGRAARDQDERSIACRSAPLPAGEELAWLGRGLRIAARRAFDEWF